MAVHTFGLGQKLYIAQFDLSSFAKALSISAEVEPQDATSMADTARNMVPGMRAVSWDAELFFDGNVDEKLQALLNSVNAAGGMGDGTAALMSYLPDGAVVDGRAFFQRSMLGSANLPLSLGEVFVQSITGMPYDGGRGQGAAELARGSIAMAGSKGGGSTIGSALNLGDLPDASYQIQLGAHCTAMVGGSPQLTLFVESDDNAGFTSATLRATSTPITAVGAIDIPPILGPITDTHWRVRCDFNGTSSTFVASLARSRRFVP